MIVLKLLPIKAHFFFFMAALGPVLPQLQVFGKQLGISSVVMGTITGILPIAYLLAKPLFGAIVDIHREQRKEIFMGLIAIMVLSYGSLVFIPSISHRTFHFEIDGFLNPCDNTGTSSKLVELRCSSNCSIEISNLMVPDQSTWTQNVSICVPDKRVSLKGSSCKLDCRESADIPLGMLLKSPSFWYFVILMSVGTIAFNVVNSISDAVCFDVIGDEYDYGKQRTWGAVGYGSAALLSGYAMDNFFIYVGGFKAAICIMMVFTIFDLISCLKLKLPIIPAPKKIWNELANLMQHKNVTVFLLFTILAGIPDGFLSYFLLWYVEDIAAQTNTTDVKVLEGFIIAAGTFGGNILFFYIGDNILKKLGHVNCFTICFLAYALKLCLISLVWSPWNIVAIYFFLQGPTFALTYLTIVAYANEIAPLGASATMQGIAAGLDDGLGYALGSFVGGLLYRYAGARQTFQLFAGLSCVSGVSHFLIHRLRSQDDESVEPLKKVTFKRVPQTNAEMYSD